MVNICFLVPIHTPNKIAHMEILATTYGESHSK